MTCYVCMNLLVDSTSMRSFNRYRTELRCPTPNCSGWVCQTCYRNARTNRTLRVLSRCGLCRGGPMLKIVRHSAIRPALQHRRRPRPAVQQAQEALVASAPLARAGIGGSSIGAWSMGARFLYKGGAAVAARSLRSLRAFGTTVWRRFRLRRAHIALVCTHTWFVSTWSGALASWYTFQYQFPGCGPEFTDQGTYLPLRNGVYDWKLAALDIERARVHGVPTSGFLGVMVCLGVPSMHAAIDACLALGDAPILDISARWLCSGAVYIILTFYSMRTMLLSIVSGPLKIEGVEGDEAPVILPCSAEYLTTALVLAHGVSIMLFTVWAAITGDVARRASLRERSARISL